MKKLFTLIELIVVIVILGILSAIVVPNISSFKEEAKEAALLSDIRNLQTTTDLYSLKNDGAVPTKENPTFGNPKIIELYALKPEYLRSLPKEKLAKFWLDSSHTVWGSTVDSPTNVSYNQETRVLSWQEVERAESYNIYQEKESVTSSVKTPSIVLVEKGINPVGKAGSLHQKTMLTDTDKIYLMSAVDKYGFESAPVRVETTYKGYGEGPDKNFVLNPINTVGDKEVTEPPLPGTPAEEIPEGTPVEPARPGVFVQYGNYNGHPLVWNVIEKDQEKMTLFLDQAIKMTGGAVLKKRFHSTSNNRWEVSELRTWLNTTFYNAAFANKTPISEVSKEFILSKTYASTADSGTEAHVYVEDFATGLQNYDNSYKKVTVDKVYLPTMKDMSEKIYPALGEYSYSEFYWIWLMDARGDNSADVRAFTSTGKFGHSSASYAGGAIKPMMTIKATDFTTGEGTYENPYILE